MKPGISKGVGAGEVCSHSATLCWVRQEGERPDEPSLSWFPPPPCTDPCRSQRGAQRLGRAGSQMPLAPPVPGSSPAFSNPGERSSPKDQLSLDSLTPESCRLALTADPFWKVTGPEKCKGCVGVEGAGGGGREVQSAANCPHRQLIRGVGQSPTSCLGQVPSMGMGIPRSNFLTLTAPLGLVSAHEIRPGGCPQQSPLSTTSCPGGNAHFIPPLLSKQEDKDLELGGERGQTDYDRLRGA